MRDFLTGLILGLFLLTVYAWVVTQSTRRVVEKLSVTVEAMKNGSDSADK